MKQSLIFLPVLLVCASSSVQKPGSCVDLARSRAKFGACVIACGGDLDCKDSKKCCSTGCGLTCQEPACPKGVSRVNCPSSLCTFSQCPNAPDAFCRIDSCGQCKVEYYNQTTWEKISCTNEGQNLCERMRDFGKRNPMPGRYVPACTKDGKFQSLQHRGSVLVCVDEETGIPDFQTSTKIGTGTPDCTKKAQPSECELAREKASRKLLLGQFIPECKEDGSYAEKQCHEGFCWCVDKKGREWFGTRPSTRKESETLDCVKSMCPKDVKKVENCDPMICAVASCPGFKKSELSCRINPCGQCKAEFLDKYDRNVTCQTCANKVSAIGRRRIGQYVPQCDQDGNYQKVQCWGSIGRCWCVDRLTGDQVDGTMTRGTPNCNGPSTTLLLAMKPASPKPEPVCPNGLPMMLCLRPFCRWSSGCASNAKAKCRVDPCKACAVEYFDENDQLIDCNGEMSECELKRADALSSKNIGIQPVGRFIPRCDKDGNYSRIQCWGSTGYCWCVDRKTGVEQELTRVRGTPDCDTKTHVKLFVNKTQIKPGRCPTVQPTDSCDKKCANDEECPGKSKCCDIRCGKTCREPAVEDLACPNGRPFLLCIHLCQLASCPAHPEAQCTVDPCQMCKVEFKDSMGKVVNCSENLTPCQLQRAQSLALLGSYRPQCEDDGRYKPIQCHGSIGYCWCVDEDGHEIENTRQRGVLNCSNIASRKVLTKCQQMLAKALKTGLLGVKTPQCEDDGRFKQIQTWEAYQWCVDENGIELLGTRKGPGEGQPDCNQACSPVMCMMYCQYGFVKDSRGCEICKCASAPLKPGLCPPVGAKAVTYDDCEEDLDCAGTMKCCEKKCTISVNHVKPGYCPRFNVSSAGDCESKCSQDSDCAAVEKCCASGCNRECLRPARRVCPNGAPLVMCVRNMCDDKVSCPAYPEATCRMNYCGQCSVEFVLSNGTIVDCGQHDEKLLSDKRECTRHSKTMFFCSSSLCHDKVCLTNRKAVCKVPALSCDCGVQFYDKNGNQVDCLTECQRKRKEVEDGPPLVGAFKPSCEPDGSYSRKQCHGSTGYCWCVSEDGTEWPGTRVRGELDCSDKKQPDLRGIHIRLSFDANFNRIKDNTEKFKTVLVEYMKDMFGIHSKQMEDIKVISGSIIVEFVLVRHEEGGDIRNVSSNLRRMVLEEEFVIRYGGEAMVAKPESYSSSVQINQMAGDDHDSSSSAPVLAIVLGVVFGVLAVALVIGILFFVRQRKSNKYYRGMSVNTYDTSRPMTEK